MKIILLVGLGGFLGTVARFLLGIWALDHLPANLPYGTLGVNLIGSLIIGILSGLMARSEYHLWHVFLVTGFCGGFTTFSTFSLDNMKLLKEHLFGPFLLYGTISIIGGLLLCVTGFWIASKVVR